MQLVVRGTNLVGGGGASRGVGVLELLVHLGKGEGLEVKSITDGQ